ncbi:PREDICTED: ATP-dependent DNA helicase Q-like SIM isoform X1 [Fragaria vesca subsp. vesca]|uniref:ATP-dependent DNA helicase Q-like SIM isoform X1 n=1 Tax=Fragaria vesca subsp. vesca TaxID=101020 RepID=UPI0002C2E6AB|nr:PREDICTED: ATP-dependent DNA helicase Q-like SIM isoform X1 [Fragaria vesca subsp. vesca]
MHNMNGNGVSGDEVIAKLLEMGFENSSVVEAVKEVGPSFDVALEFILNGCCRSNQRASSSSTSKAKAPGKRALPSSKPLGQIRQSSILDHFQSSSAPKRRKTDVVPDVPVFGSESVHGSVDQCVEVLSELPSVGCLDIGSDWEKKAESLLQKHFGFFSLKPFQKEVLAAWLAHKDTLVLAATGSGKSLCFQIPALLTGKVVVVISPLISLMHDQCLRLAKHGVSACFLGSGQPDSTVENKAMKGVYNIIYVCPETILRLIKPLQNLVEIRGIALFAIDEVHCVSKWGHDFRPDYRRLSELRKNFSASNLKFLDFDIPLMALTATATIQVREDILNSLSMSKETKVVLTSFFRPNLRFRVQHSKTSTSSYENDFLDLIDMYMDKRGKGEKKQLITSEEVNEVLDSSSNSSVSEADCNSENELDNIEDGNYDRFDEANALQENGSSASKGRELSVDYLENEVDVFQSVDDWDVSCGEFCGLPLCEDMNTRKETTSDVLELPNQPEERLRFLQQPLEKGSTIIYVPTRKQTLKIATYLCRCGLKAAAYHAGLPKSRLRQVHKMFHENTIEVVVATIAFGMGIDKLNVRRIIHYGWPQSLEAYYQEAGRAGRDGKLADCILFANLTRAPSLLPSRRSEEQTKQAYRMLSDCFRYGMASSCCRAKKLVEYFGEDFSHDKCLLCDVCVTGPPEMQNFRKEADVLLQVIAAHDRQGRYKNNDIISNDIRRESYTGRLNLRMIVSKIREQSQQFMATQLLWWQGLLRIMEGKGFVREEDDKTHVQLKFPKLTELGLEFLLSEKEKSFYVHPEADMLLSASMPKSFSTFSEWGKGWADPEIRCQRLESFQHNRSPQSSFGKRGKRKSRKQRTRKSSASSQSVRTVRGRIEAKLSKQSIRPRS